VRFPKPSDTLPTRFYELWSETKAHYWNWVNVQLSLSSIKQHNKKNSGRVKA